MKPFCKQVLVILQFGISVAAAQDSIGIFDRASELNKSRLTGVLVTEGVGYTGLMIGLNELWYKGYDRRSFHFFNDNYQWLQMDKIGHVATGYYVGKLGMDALKWSGVDARKAVWYGGSLGLLFLTSVEVFDGFSAAWGASGGDMIANMAGAGLLIGQEYLWQEQRVLVKFSAHLTDYAQYRPVVLGSTIPERLMKDYNGQTYWLSYNIASFTNGETKIPKWLNIAVGYSGNEMIKGDVVRYMIVKNTSNPADVETFTRYRQYFFSVDIDLTRIKTRSGFLKAVFNAFGFLKIPAPALEFNEQDGFHFRPFYF